MRVVLGVASVLVALTAAPAVAQTAATPPAADKAADAAKTVCKAIPNPGSRVGGKRVCMTRGEWEEMARNAKRDYDRRGEYMGGTSSL